MPQELTVAFGYAEPREELSDARRRRGVHIIRFDARAAGREAQGKPPADATSESGSQIKQQLINIATACAVSGQPLVDNDCRRELPL